MERLILCGGGHVSLLMGEQPAGDTRRGRDFPRRASARQEAGHIRALHLLRPVGGCHGGQRPARLAAYLLQHLGKLPHMMKDRVALTQPHLSRLHRQQLFGLPHLPLPAVQQGGGGGIVAGIQPQIETHGAGSSWGASSRAMPPSTPLMKDASSSPPYFFASSTASLMETLTGISSTKSIS